MKLMTIMALGTLLLAPLSVLSEPKQVFVVRHAERAEEPKGDPAISAEGVARAELLAQMLAATKLQAILTTQYRRTQETAAPTAKRLGLTPKILTIQRGGADAHVEELIAEVHKTPGPILVVGHSNTVAGIVAGLSSSKPIKLCEISFANLFVLTLDASPLPAAQLKYGKPDVAPEPGCQ